MVNEHDRRSTAERIEDQVNKDVIKEALKEWLDTQFAMFGRWTFYGIISAALAGGVWMAIKGWH
jgi:hypothetical protein